MNIHATPCTRCGKMRIIEKSWTESRETMAGTATVSYTKMICPDPECQKIVEASLAMDHEKRVETARIKERSILQHKRALLRARAKAQATTVSH